jgi:hypothetical protein
MDYDAATLAYEVHGIRRLVNQGVTSNRDTA